VVANFDGEPTADSEMFSKMNKTVRKDVESKVSIPFTYFYVTDLIL